MIRSSPSTNRPGGTMSPGRLRGLSVAVLVGRNRWATRGDAASYRLTARAAELAVSADLLALPAPEQAEYARWLAKVSAESLLTACPEEGS